MTDLDLMINDDYIVMRFNGLELYYGYEYAYELNPGVDLEDDCGSTYGLILKRGDRRIIAVPDSVLPKTPGEETMEARLLAGIAYLLTTETGEAALTGRL